jgi:hypothetical protein
MYVIKFVSKIVLTIESLFHENFMKEKKKNPFFICKWKKTYYSFRLKSEILFLACAQITSSEVGELVELSEN